VNANVHAVRIANVHADGVNARVHGVSSLPGYSFSP
jgi:hypothetical protein